MNLTDFQDWAVTAGGIAVWLTILCGLLFGSLLWGADRRMRLGRDVALIALLAAVASASRVLFAAIPNVQPVTLLILMIGVHLGARRATAVAVLVALMSNMALGHGPWTFYQALAWSAVGTSGAISRRLLVNWDGTEVRLGPLCSCFVSNQRGLLSLPHCRPTIRCTARGWKCVVCSLVSA